MALGQRLFHAQGYEGVGLAALTEVLGIKPPSFYKAFGSKAEFFAEVLERYAASVLALDTYLLPGRPPHLALALLLEEAARTYVQDPTQRGCLVLEAVRGEVDEPNVQLARKVAESRRERVRDFVAASHPHAAQAVADYIGCTLSGLSACAREGMGEARLLAVARAAGAAVAALLGP
nr:TetR/AcrR family transcriptional regulator [Pseudomonas typographi]